MHTSTQACTHTDTHRRGGGEREWRLDRVHRPERPRRPWTAARTMEVLRRCLPALAQQLVYYAVAVSTAVLGRATRTMSVAPLLSNNLQQRRSPTFAAQLHLPAHDLFWANLRVQHYLPPLDLAWTRKSV